MWRSTAPAQQRELPRSGRGGRARSRGSCARFRALTLMNDTPRVQLHRQRTPNANRNAVKRVRLAIQAPNFTVVGAQRSHPLCDHEPHRRFDTARSLSYDRATTRTFAMQRRIATQPSRRIWCLPACRARSLEIRRDGSLRRCGSFAAASSSRRLDPRPGPDGLPCPLTERHRFDIPARRACDKYDHPAEPAVEHGGGGR